MWILGNKTATLRGGARRGFGRQPATTTMALRIWMQVPVTLLLLTTLLAAVSVHAKEFRAYWNIPTFHCKRYDLPPVDLHALYGIQQNDNDNFRGNKISILYDPGLFPALLANGSQPLFRRNGGVPQAGNLQKHLELFARVLDDLMPDRQNDGLGIIDFESWRPNYRQNFGTLEPYKKLSIQLQRDAHWLWPKQRIEAEAKRAFEAAARQFMGETVRLAEQLRPRARWGYYGLPFCFNGRSTSAPGGECAANIRAENDATQWLYDASQVIYPSVYMNEKMLPENRGPMVRGRVNEAKRMARRGQPVIAYHRYVMTDSRKYLSEDDTVAALRAMRNNGAEGVILWGASRDLNSRDKCVEFYKYLAEVLGPVVRRYTAPKNADDSQSTTTEPKNTVDSHTTTTSEPEDEILKTDNAEANEAYYY